MSQYGENNPHFRPRERQGPTIPQNIQPEPMQPWDYHPTQIPPPERIQPRPRLHSQPPISVARPPMSLPGHDPEYHEPVEPAYPRPPTPPRRHRTTIVSGPVIDTPLHPPGRHSRPIDGLPGRHPDRHSLPLDPHAPLHQPGQHSRPMDGLPGRQHNRHSLPLDPHAPLHQPGRHSRPMDGLPGRQPNRHSLPLDPHAPPVFQPKPKPKRQPRPHHGSSEPRPRHENLMYPDQSRTKPITWCGAVFCIILWLVIILGGILVLVVYLVYRPRTPHFELSSASLNAVYLDMGYLLNADLTVLVNFTNPNKKVNVDFNYVILQLYFDRHLIANQYIEPFSAFSGEDKLANVELVSSQVRLPIPVIQKLATQMQRNRIMFEIDGIFHARSNFGSLLKYSYWLYGHCNIEMTGPPSGITISSKCYTKD